MEPLRFRCHFVILAVSFILASLSTQNVRAADLNIDDTLRAIAGSEQQLKNLHVDGSYREEAQVGQDQWKPTTVMTDATAWLSGNIDGPARVEVHREVMPWSHSGGVPPYLEDSRVVTWDGKVGVDLELTTGRLGQSGHSSRTTIYSKFPPPADIFAVACGGEFSIYYYHVDGADSQTFSQHLSQSLADIPKYPQAHWTSDCRNDVLDKTPVIHIFLGKKAAVEFDWWVDPARGYALLRDEYRGYKPTGELVVHDVMEIKTLTQAAPGVWYPTEAFLSSREPTSNPDNPAEKVAGRLHYLARSVTANNPNLDPGVFDQVIPPGRMITDADTGKSYLSDNGPVPDIPLSVKLYQWLVR